ncbi:WD40 repeat-like protein [Tilletiaria anomala UBC 951]|uniref:DNA damage-binding protein CMR1 n=1 Tax=Tilletiaria anomala (strain ATCC 24038 / CBS 436.72 / UBC 951) TaxID=1037660 RepID=A0A066VRM4_TILAU|nr:WD40 repeat-like protein [Tilletiaria anomala UBC 951]KDN44146.1 WD40 repeat-like protein [Tilletiaria anomala UBC 951]
MRELQVLGGSEELGLPKAKPDQVKKKPSSRPRKTPPAPKRDQPIRATRSSARLQGFEAENESLKRKHDEEAEQARLAAEQAKKAKHEDHNLATLTEGLLGEEESELLRQSLLQASMSARPTQTPEDYRPARLSSDAQELSKILNRMSLQSTSKVTAARVYSMIYHPSEEKDLVFMGDKEGNIGVWDALVDEAETNDDADTLQEGKAWSLHTHGRSPVTCLRFDPVDSDCLFSSSYDSTIRMLSLTSSTSSEVWGGQEDVLLSIFDILAPAIHPSAFTHTPSPGADERSIWIGDHRGGLVHLDIRENKTRRGSSRRWQVCEKKIGAMSVNQVAPHCIATASLDQHVRLFDVRALKSIKLTPDAPANYKGVDVEMLQKTHDTAQVASHQAKRACTSVDFSPRGDKLVAVTYDDMVKVWDTNLSTLKVKATLKGKASSDNHADTLASSGISIPHNNQTGRWLTLFRAVWNRNPDLPPHFSMGAMNHRAEIYSADGILLRALHDEAHVTAVPAVTAMHPRRPGRLATANASGRTTLWA